MATTTERDSKPPVRSEMVSKTAAGSIGSTDSGNSEAARGSREEGVEVSACEAKPISQSKLGLEVPL